MAFGRLKSAKVHTVLIICPNKTQCRIMSERLRYYGLENVKWKQKKIGEEVTLLDGLKHLLEDGNCNLGWRIVGEKLLDPKAFKGLLEESNSDKPKKFTDLIPEDEKKDVRRMLTALRAIRDGKPVEDMPNFVGVLQKVGIDICEIARDHLKGEIESCRPTPPK